MRYNVTCTGAITLAASWNPDMYVWNQPTNPICHLCKDQQLPGNPWGAANIMLPGAKPAGIYKCETLHKMGLENKITPQMCKPIQYFMAQICECREFKRKDKPNGWTVISPKPPFT